MTSGQISRKIIHIDMDCFYAAVEMRDRPDLKGKPIAVGGSPEGRGVIATASYEARKYGVRSAMASSHAMRLCPTLQLLRPNFNKYKAESKKVRAILERFSDLIEPLSLDEAYIDVTSSPHLEGSATRIAKEILRLIQEETGGLTASAGVAPNKFLAKVASEWNKPNGIKVIRPSEIDELMPQLKIEKINGVGKVTAERMHKMGIHTCGDLQKLSIPELSTRFGSWGIRLHDYARGIDNRPVESSWERKSLSVEETYRDDLPNLKACLEQIPELYDEWLARMNRSGLAERIRGSFVKLKFFDFQSTTHEVASASFPQIADFQKLLEGAFERRHVPVRLIGIGVRLATSDETLPSDSQLKFELE